MLKNLRADVRYLRKAILKEIYHLNAQNERITLESLADNLGCHRATVIRNINALAALGYIKKTPGRGYGVASQYELLSPAIEALK